MGDRFGKRRSAYLDGDEQGVAYRRSDVADAEIVDEDEAELDGTHAKGLNDGQEQRGKDEDRGG